MRKIFFASAIVIAAVFIFGAASANKHHQKAGVAQNDTGYAASGEATTSMSDCMTYAASFKPRAKAAALADFERQYGKPAGTNKGVTYFNYDKYTQVLLDCSKGSCFCRCLGKNY